MAHAIDYRIAHTPTQFEEGRKLFAEYVKSLGVDLSRQDFTRELATIEQQYHAPAGALLPAYHQGEAIACAGVRKLDDYTAGLKRMYVRDGYMGRAIYLEKLLDGTRTN